VGSWHCQIDFRFLAITASHDDLVRDESVLYFGTICFSLETETAVA
jgi:hypothetical protein